ncbi:MAG: hypothetical protein SH819_12020 [Cytophagales bacterium]|nr:hypothetical protein [Cytophagales bacterium]
MKTVKIAGVALATASLLLSLAFTFSHQERRLEKKKTTYRSIPKGCVFRTVMGEEPSLKNAIYFTPANALRAIDGGLAWVVNAQNPNGGWGAGTHHRQDVMDPHAVEADPATTSMVAMALLRSGNSLTNGAYSQSLRKALTYLLGAVESSDAQRSNITNQTGTQIQVKLGSNIDVILTSQFLSNLLDGYLDHDPVLKKRVRTANDQCVSKIQRTLGGDGSVQGSGWAGVLQSSFATNALEAAQAQGAQVDEKKLDQARNFQKSNYDSKTGR